MAGLANNHSYTAGMIGWFLIFLGAAMFLLGSYNSTMGDDGLILNLIPNKYGEILIQGHGTYGSGVVGFRFDNLIHWYVIFVF